MNREQAHTVVADCLAGIAPEIDLAIVDPRARLRDAVDLDSIDFLGLIEAIYDRTGISIPEESYEDVDTLGGLEGYLVAHAAEGDPGQVGTFVPGS